MATAEKKGRQDDRLAMRPPPSFEQRIFSPQSIAAIIEELVAEGLTPAEALEGTGLSLDQLNAYTTRVSYRQIDQVIRNALRLTSREGLGLLVGQRMKVTAYGMYGYALLSSPNRAAARDFAARYIRVVGPLCDFAVENRPETTAIVFDPLHWPNPTDDVHRFAIEFALSAHLQVTRDRVGSHFKFLAVEVDYARPAYSAAYDARFNCPILYNQAVCCYEQPLDEGPVALADMRTHAMAREICEQLLDEINQAGGVSSDIRRILIQQPGRFPSITAVAKQLGLHPRALRRKLEAEGASYRDILAELRMRLAIEYLRKTQMTNEDIAGRLGYSDAANFRHAFIRWTGKSPSDFRRGDRNGG